MTGDGLERRDLHDYDEDLSLPKRARPLMRSPNGREVLAKTHPRCETCRSDYREDIELQRIAGYSIPLILDALPEGHGLNYHMVYNHCRKHVAAPQSLRARMVHEQALRLGISEDYIGSLVTPDLLIDTVLQRSYELISMGVLEPTMKDAIAAANAKTEREKLAGDNLDHSAVLRILVSQQDAFREALRQFAPAIEQPVLQLANTLSESDEYLAGFASDTAKHQAIPAESRLVLDGEVIEELELLPVAFAHDNAPAVDSATSTPYSLSVVFDSAPARDSATAIVIPAAEVPDE